MTLSEWMDADGLSLSAVARACGVSRQAVWQWRRGTWHPSARNLAVLERLSGHRVTATSVVGAEVAR